MNPIHSPSRRRLAYAAAGLALFGLTACSNEKGAPVSASPASKGAASGPVTMQELALRAHGFSVGDAQLRPIYVFFDPQCGHCAKLWENLRELRSAAHFKWLPVAILNRASSAQGAAFLGAPDPVALMEEHEASMTQKRGGISAPSSFSEEMRQKLETNTLLLQRLKAEGVPFMIGSHAVTNQTVTLGGAVPAAVAAQTFGLLQAPPSTPAALPAENTEPPPAAEQPAASLWN